MYSKQPSAMLSRSAGSAPPRGGSWVVKAMMATSASVGALTTTNGMRQSRPGMLATAWPIAVPAPWLSTTHVVTYARSSGGNKSESSPYMIGAAPADATASERLRVDRPTPCGRALSGQRWRTPDGDTREQAREEELPEARDKDGGEAGRLAEDDAGNQ